MSIELEGDENELRKEIEVLLSRVYKAFERYDIDDGNANNLRGCSRLA